MGSGVSFGIATAVRDATPDDLAVVLNSLDTAGKEKLVLVLEALEAEKESAAALQANVTQAAAVVSTLSGEQVFIGPPLPQNVAALKLAVQELIGIPPRMQRILFDAREIQETDDLVNLVSTAAEGIDGIVRLALVVTEKEAEEEDEEKKVDVDYHKIFQVVAELHRRGYQRLRIFPLLSPSGCYWRCNLMPLDNIVPMTHSFPLEYSDGLLYSSGEGPSYLNGVGDLNEDSAVTIADAIVGNSDPDDAEDVLTRALGEDEAYTAWFTGEFLAKLPTGALPCLVQDSDEQDPYHFPILGEQHANIKIKLPPVVSAQAVMACADAGITTAVAGAGAAVAPGLVHAARPGVGAAAYDCADAVLVQRPRDTAARAAS